ncbi:MAG: hypothetical protein JWQ42_5064 [Edaphobacter sp.]|nr:hypothetical protein [Edaphobacter sp.]
MVFPVWTLCFLIGCVAGLRSLMAPAIICAAAYLGWVHLGGTPLGFLDHKVTLVIFTILAIGELAVDKLPSTPPRTAPPALIARIVMGALAGAAMAVGRGAGLGMGALLGAVAAGAVAFAGYYIRRGLVKQTRLPDVAVAVLEDLLTISGGLFVVSRL